MKKCPKCTRGLPDQSFYAKIYPNGKVVQDITANATFHCWGLRTAKQSDSNPKGAAHAETVGVCELEDGRMRLVRPEKILFTDRVPKKGSARIAGSGMSPVPRNFLRKGSNMGAEKKKELWNIQELMAYLKVSRSTAYQFIATKKIPYLKVGRLMRFVPDEVEKAIRRMPA